MPTLEHKREINRKSYYKNRDKWVKYARDNYSRKAPDKMSSYDYLKEIDFESVPDNYRRFRDTFLFISEDGRVWNGILNVFVKGGLDKRNYTVVNYANNGKRYKYGIYRMMAECFIPNPNNYPLVRHLDDDRNNNVLPNLAWGNKSDNMKDAIINGKIKRLKK